MVMMSDKHKKMQRFRHLYRTNPLVFVSENPVIKDTSDRVLACFFFLPLKCLKKLFFVSLQILCKQRKCVRSRLACLHL